MVFSFIWYDIYQEHFIFVVRISKSTPLNISLIYLLTSVKVYVCPVSFIPSNTSNLVQLSMVIVGKIILSPSALNHQIRFQLRLECLQFLGEEIVKIFKSTRLCCSSWRFVIFSYNQQFLECQ